MEKSHLRGESPSEPWGCHTGIISFLLGGETMFICLTSMGKMKEKSENKEINLSLGRF